MAPGDDRPAGDSPACEHADMRDGACARCGHPCEHDVILNGACLYCGETELDGVALSPKPAAAIIPAARLTTRR